MRDDLLSSCANSTCTTPERSIAEAAHEAMQQSGVTTGGDVAAPCTDTPGIPAVSPTFATRPRFREFCACPAPVSP